MDLHTLALAIDARVGDLPSVRSDSRLFSVHADPDARDGIGLDLLGIGEARDLPRHHEPRPGAIALALIGGGWAAPMEDDGTMTYRPSIHPRRRRMSQTVVVGAGDPDHAAVLRVGTDEPLVICGGGVGVVLERMLASWARRRIAA